VDQDLLSGFWLVLFAGSLDERPVGGGAQLAWPSRRPSRRRMRKERGPGLTARAG
jgi:hypothetical protein